jgi:hypothetical protein
MARTEVETLLDDKSLVTEVNDTVIESIYATLDNHYKLFGVVLTVDNIISVTEK